MLSENDSKHRKKISEGNQLMDAINQIAKFSRTIVFVVIALIIGYYPACCEEIKIDNTEELISKQYKNYLNEFHRVFGKQMENEFGLKWIEGGGYTTFPAMT